MSGTINLHFVSVDSVPSPVRFNYVDYALSFFNPVPGVTAATNQIFESANGKTSYWARARAHQDMGDYLKFNGAEIHYRKNIDWWYGENSFYSDADPFDPYDYPDVYWWLQKESTYNVRNWAPYGIMVHNPLAYNTIDYQSITGGSSISATEWNYAYTTGLTVSVSGVYSLSPFEIVGNEGESTNIFVRGTSTDTIETSFLNTTANEFEFAIAGEKFFKRSEEDNYILKNRMTVDAAGCISRTIREDRYKSPAGLQRGNILNAEYVRPNPTDSLISDLYDLNINYVKEIEDEYYLFGDKTRGLSTSTFSRLNVSMLFVYLKKNIAPAIREVLFEQNDSTTRTRVNIAITQFLRKVQAEDGISEFKVVCDETNNTPDIIDSNQLVVDVFVKPKKSINFIKIRFTNTENL